MKVVRRKFNIFEQMELAHAEANTSGPVEEYILTPEEFHEFTLDAKNRPGASFRKVTGRPNDSLGGDWYFRGALVRLNGKTKN
ncbi:MAG: hypothetical protein EB127_07230 [Alphaproteobacteria bacterium]|nr:hypothetical protein [Alphaproteobacteria bacterium]